MSTKHQICVACRVHACAFGAWVEMGSSGEYSSQSFLTPIKINKRFQGQREKKQVSSSIKTLSRYFCVLCTYRTINTNKGRIDRACTSKQRSSFDHLAQTQTLFAIPPKLTPLSGMQYGTRYCCGHHTKDCRYLVGKMDPSRTKNYCKTKSRTTSYLVNKKKRRQRCSKKSGILPIVL